MKAQEIQTIHDILMERVVPKNAREGVAIAGLAARLVSHFAKDHAPQQSPQQTAPTSPSEQRNPDGHDERHHG
jgi:hypothetical protein